ncbi:hypothetical protein P4S73_01560 [Paraglaciecola sp. Hal342]
MEIGWTQNFIIKTSFPILPMVGLLGISKLLPPMDMVGRRCRTLTIQEFARRAKVTTQVIADEVKNNPWCIGVFIDNEKSWGNPASIESHYRIPIQNF